MVAGRYRIHLHEMLAVGSQRTLQAVSGGEEHAIGAALYLQCHCIDTGSMLRLQNCREFCLLYLQLRLSKSSRVYQIPFSQR